MVSQELNAINVVTIIGDTRKKETLVEILIVLANTHLLELELELV